MKTLTNTVRAVQWRMLPGLPAFTVNADSGDTPGLGRIALWSQVRRAALVTGQDNMSGVEWRLVLIHRSSLWQR